MVRVWEEKMDYVQRREPDTPLENILAIYEVVNGVEWLGERVRTDKSTPAFTPQYERAWEKSIAH
jgi:hypothetical protein